MEVLVKTDNGLQRLGEGKIFSKKQLKLKEGIDAAIGSANGLQQAQQKAKKLINQNPSVDSASADLGKLDGQKDTSTGEGTTIQLPINASATQLNNVQRMSNDNVEVKFTKNDTNNSSSSSTNESRKNRKLVEMRYNSVPFTKKELSSFLKSI
jgi:hypothetical protein